jgi:hypothetical protein
MDTYNPAGHPEDPTLGMMANSPTTPALKTLQMMKDLFLNASREYNAIESPEIAYEEELKWRKHSIEDLFTQFGEDIDRRTIIKQEIEDQAGDLRMFQVHGRASAEHVWKDQVASVLQNFCNRLIVTIEPVFIKRSLEQIAQDRLKEYVPHDLVENEEIPVTGSDSERFTIINPLFEVYSLAASPSYILG